MVHKTIWCRTKGLLLCITFSALFSVSEWQIAHETYSLHHSNVIINFWYLSCLTITCQHPRDDLWQHHNYWDQWEGFACPQFPPCFCIAMATGLIQPSPSSWWCPLSRKRIRTAWQWLWAAHTQASDLHAQRSPLRPWTPREGGGVGGRRHGNSRVHEWWRRPGQEHEDGCCHQWVSVVWWRVCKVFKLLINQW